MPRAGRMTTERAKDFKGTLRQLLRAMSRYRLSVAVVVLFAMLSTIFNIAGPKVLAQATTALATGWVAKLQGTGGIDFAFIGRILLILLGMYLLSAAFSFVQSWLMSGLSQKICYDFRRQISEKINRLPLAYFEKRTVGEVLSRITNDVDTLGQSLNQSITQFITSVTTMIGVLVMMLSISARMTLIALLILPVSLALVLVVVRFSQRYFRAQQATLGVVNGQVEEVYSGHNVIKAFNREEAVLQDFNAANDQLYTSAWKSQFLSGLMMPIMNFVGNLGYVAVAIVGSIFAAAGIITIGDIQAFIQYVKNFTQPIQQLSQVSNMLQSMAAAAERVFEFLAEPEEDQQADPARRADPAVIDGQVTFDHVKFGYTPEKTVIRDFSCTVCPGQKVAIVGPTGAGKTTMVKLLMRFYDVDSGSITLNGHNVRDFDRTALREGFGMVLQDTWLFQGTIMENIRYGRLDATDEEVIAAAKAAGADHFIRTLPGGYQMELNEDASNVSQGQKQLLTIARTILADNRILVLDEATSSVDTRTEQRIQAAMDRLMQGRTSFIIAHRLSTIRNADLILVMRDGDIVEQGTHDQLMAAEGFYAELYNSQFEDVTA
ncbi:MAG TPA: ABC transporter ATP-binding protein/permease [Candidatus Gemmiger excrementavium]|uniref:ABC transporter ATP-binding protein/permease n=1 Tax=Candidatus Gemmiger excrementavium TaxID=2838608 RepID=A0A9D2F1L3_9FIRM|nr:ABC transporter ATP-binding protein/permease [Candidatus Gemmiger excrementavium]